MTLPPVDFVPDAVLEERALGLIREHEHRRGTVVRLPVPIEKIVEHTLELQVVWLPIDEEPGDVILARIDPDYLGKPTIQMNERRQSHFDAYFGTEQFSVAHEGGHWVLHYHRSSLSAQPLLPGLEADRAPAPILCRRTSSQDRREIQAEKFAAYLLMPEYLMREVAAACDLPRWSTIQALARDCGVSPTALKRRLKELRLIDLMPDGTAVSPGHHLSQERWV